MTFSSFLGLVPKNEVEERDRGHVPVTLPAFLVFPLINEVVSAHGFACFSVNETRNRRRRSAIGRRHSAQNGDSVGSNPTGGTKIKT